MSEVYATPTLEVNVSTTCQRVTAHIERMAHDNDLRKRFGIRLKAARNACAMTLERAGAELTALGWPASKQTVSHYETGRNLPDPLMLRKLCRLYNVTADSLLWGADDADRPDNAGLDPALAERLARATPDQRALIRQLIITTLDGLHVPAGPLEKPRRAA